MSFVEIAATYADEVVSGEITAEQHEVATCQQFIDDLGRDDMRLDSETVDTVCSHLARLGSVTPKQAFLVANAFGWES